MAIRFSSTTRPTRLPAATFVRACEARGLRYVALARTDLDISNPEAVRAAVTRAGFSDSSTSERVGAASDVREVFAFTMRPVDLRVRVRRRADRAAAPARASGPASG